LSVLIYSSKKKLIILDYLYENKFNKLSKLISSILLRIEKFYGSKNQKQQSAWFRLQVRPGQARSGSRLLFHFLAWPGPSIKFLTWPAGQARLEKVACWQLCAALQRYEIKAGPYSLIYAKSKFFFL